MVPHRYGSYFVQVPNRYLFSHLLCPSCRFLPSSMLLQCIHSSLYLSLDGIVDMDQYVRSFKIFRTSTFGKCIVKLYCFCEFILCWFMTVPLISIAFNSSLNKMSDSSESEHNIEIYEDSPPASPSPLSSPTQCVSSDHSSNVQSNLNNNSSSEFEELSDNSSPNSTRTSPPSSPDRHGQKRPSYAAYKDNQ